MPGNFQRQSAGERKEAGFGRMLLVSLGIHLAVVGLFSGLLLPRMQRDLRPVYYVDLVNLPVRDPQAGRPDARPPSPAASAPKAAPPQPAPAPKPQAPPPAPTPAPAPKPPPPVAAAPKAAPAPAPKAAPPASRPAEPPRPAPPPAATEQELAQRLEQMRRQREREELRERLAQLAQQDTRQAPASNAPVGMPEGRGSEAGVDEKTWIQAFLRANWALSEYQVGGRLDLVARVQIKYGASGLLADYRILKGSGDVNFDESVKRAILKEKQLPFKPERTLDLEVEFNLKDLMNRR